MNFDKFLNQKYERRTDFIHLPMLVSCFDDEIQAEITRQGDECEDLTAIHKKVVGFRIQSLTGFEYGKAAQKANDSIDILTIADNLLSGEPAKVVGSLKKLYGQEDGAQIAKDDILNVYLIYESLVYPVIPEDQKLTIIYGIYKNFPIYFKLIANKVRILTEAGHVPGEPQGSIKEPNTKTL